MSDLLEALKSPWQFLLAAIFIGFIPRLILRVVLFAYRKDNPHRREILAEYFAVPRIWRLIWVFEQAEAALFEGLPERWSKRRRSRVMLAVRPVSIAFLLLGSFFIACNFLTAAFTPLTYSISFDSPDTVQVTGNVPLSSFNLTNDYHSSSRGIFVALPTPLPPSLPHFILHPTFFELWQIFSLLSGYHTSTFNLSVVISTSMLGVTSWVLGRRFAFGAALELQAALQPRPE